MNEKVKEITDKIIYATLATVSDEAEPWNSPVAAYHDGLEYFWASWRENQHSKNIRANGKVFIVIYDSTAPEGTGEGVYIKAHAEEVNDETEIERILKIRALTKPANRQAAEFMGEYPRRFYKAVPEKVWLNDEGDLDGNYIDVRKEIL